MNRIIKFRGKRVDNGEWIFGSLDLTANQASILWDRIDNEGDTAPWFAAVAPDTIGQFTGLCDKNGKEIYEGDIFTVNGNYPKKIEFRPEYAAFCMANLDELDKPYLEPWQRIRPDWWNDYKREICIIGNIHDNPSLISDKQ